MATSKTEESWIFDESDSSGAKAQKKIFGESKIVEIDGILSQIDKEGATDDVLQKLKEAKLEDIAAVTNAYKENMGTVIGNILKNTDLIGSEFDALRKFNTTEQALKDEADRIVEEADTLLAEAKEWGEWRNFLFGWKDRAVKARTTLVSKTIEKAQELDEKAAMLFDERLRNAEIDELLVQFRHMTSIGVERLNKIAGINIQQYDEIKIRHENALSIVQKAAKQLQELNEKFRIADDKLKSETENLVNFVNGTPQYAAQRTVIDTAQGEYDEIKSQRDKIQAGYNSKEKFAAILQANMTALKISAGNLRALAIKLRSDNEEREYTYKNTIQLIKASDVQQTSSLIDSVGNKTDQQNLEIAASVAVASEKDALQRLYEHPENMKNALKVIGAFAQVMDDNKKRLEEYQKMIEHGYLEVPEKTKPTAEKATETVEEVLFK